MPSPFPGMDPYLEQSWRDVHQALVTYVRDVLNGALPGDLFARTEERVAIESKDEIVRVIYPDVRVVEDSSRRPTDITAAASAVAEPVIIEIEPDEATESYITIREVTGERIITVIEFLSPSNKRGEGLKDYLDKRGKLIEGGINVVEIDLVRQGEWLPLMKPKFVPPKLQTPYRVMIRRATDRRRIDFYAITIQQRLPIIPIPLRPTDTEVTLDLQSIVDQAYRNGRYDRTDYSKPCDPPLEADDAKWAAQILRPSSS